MVVTYWFAWYLGQYWLHWDVTGIDQKVFLRAFWHHWDYRNHQRTDGDMTKWSLWHSQWISCMPMWSYPTQPHPFWLWTIQTLMEPKARLPQRCSHISWIQSEHVLLPRRHYVDLVFYLLSLIATMLPTHFSLSFLFLFLSLDQVVTLCNYHSLPPSPM